MENLIKGKTTRLSLDKSSTIKIMGLQLQPSICGSLSHKLALKYSLTNYLTKEINLYMLTTHAYALLIFFFHSHGSHSHNSQMHT